jgi:Mg-chelatase subunit ChlD
MVRFESPWILAAIFVVAPFLYWWHRKSYADLAPRKARLALAARILGLLALLLALSKPVLLLANSERSILVLVDVSDSVPTSALESAWTSLEQWSKEAGREREIGLVLFGREPRLVRPPGPDPLVLDEALTKQLFHRRERESTIARIQELERSALGGTETEELTKARATLSEIDAWCARIGTDETNVEAALRLARGILPEEKRRRIVLASDGNANRGALERELVELERSAFSVHTLLLPHDSAPEVIAEDLYLPAEAQVKAPFDLEVAIDANSAGKAEVKLYRNKYLVSTSEVELRQGRNLLQLPRVRLEEGFHEFEAVVKADADTQLENNVARGAVRVAGRPKVLLVERAEQEARYIEEALRAEEIEVEVRPEGGLPRDLGDLLNYDVLILSDVPAQSFAPGAMDAVETYVRDMGGGLVMLGGEASFGLGGYYRTPIEDALPVRMPIKKNVEKPNLSLALVIDKSGSMEGSKIDLAKEAAISSAEVLKKNDRFGVVAFDSRPEWVCPMTDSGEVATIRSTIARLVAGGGTNIYPALYEAYQALLSEDAKLKPSSCSPMVRPRAPATTRSSATSPRTASPSPLWGSATERTRSSSGTWLRGAAASTSSRTTSRASRRS